MRRSVFSNNADGALIAIGLIYLFGLLVLASIFQVLGV